MPDFSTYNWRELSPADQPSARQGHAMVWDGTRIIMFGGGNVYHHGLGNNAETWEYVGGNWNQLAPATSPSARRYHSMVWDGTQVILHGGHSTVDLQDTWTFDGTTWTDVTPGGTKPSVRYRHLAVWDGTRMLIYGGVTVFQLVSKDTWEFESGAWTQLTPTNYIPNVQHVGTPLSDDGRAGMTGVWDGTRILTFSGYSDGGAGGEFTSSGYQEPGGGTWQYATADWSQVGPATNPDARFDHGFCITDDDQKLLMYGGNVTRVSQDGNGFINETWQYDGSDWTELSATINPGRRETVMVWDDVNARALLFGGGDMGDPTGADAAFNDTWEFAADAPPLADVYTIRHTFGLGV